MVEFMNIFNYQISFFDNIRRKFSSSSICFYKFNKFFTISFFIFQIWKNIITLFKSISNSLDGDDPLDLRQTAAWRMAQVPRITNDAWIISLRATLA